MHPYLQVRSVVEMVLYSSDAILLSMHGLKPNRFLARWLTERVAETLGMDVREATHEIAEIEDAAKGGTKVQTRIKTRTCSARQIQKAYTKVWRRHERHIMRELCTPERLCRGCTHFEPFVSYEGIHQDCRLLDDDPELRCPNNRIRA